MNNPTIGPYCSDILTITLTINGSFACLRVRSEKIPGGPNKKSYLNIKVSGSEYQRVAIVKQLGWYDDTVTLAYSSQQCISLNVNNPNMRMFCYEAHTLSGICEEMSVEM